MSLVYFLALPAKEALAQPSAWIAWPVAMIPMALIGLVLARRIWHAMPKGKATPAAPAPVVGAPKPGGGV
jgi:OPA family glycerol-3-phosphate transporter-like MFS transporter